MLANLVVMIVASIGGAVFWWAGSRFGVMTALFLSLIGTAAGTYYGRKWTR